MKKKLFVVACLLLLAPLVEASCPSWFGQTVLYNSIKVNGNTDSTADIEVGETFVVDMYVENIGAEPAYSVHSTLVGVPDDWTVCPRGSELFCRTEWEDLLIWIGGTTTQKATIIKGDTNAEIYLETTACNAPSVVSNKISVPIFLSTLLCIVVVGAVITYYAVKERGKGH